MARFLDWRENGTYACTERCIDIGITVSKALQRYKREGNPVAGSAARNTAGNGSLMRLAPVAIRYWRDGTQLRDAAARQSRCTHGAEEAVDACQAFSEVLAEAIAGRPRSEVLRIRRGPWMQSINNVMQGAWRSKSRCEIASSGYVVHSLEAALWCVGRTGSFEEAILLAANLGDDADTTAAITGQLAGALYGANAIPQRWRAKLAWEPRIRDLATFLFNAGI